MKSFGIISHHQPAATRGGAGRARHPPRGLLCAVDRDDPGQRAQGLPHFSSLSLSGGSPCLGTLTGSIPINGG